MPKGVKKKKVNINFVAFVLTLSALIIFLVYFIYIKIEDSRKLPQSEIIASDKERISDYNGDIK